MSGVVRTPVDRRAQLLLGRVQATGAVERPAERGLDLGERGNC